MTAIISFTSPLAELLPLTITPTGCAWDATDN
jgi:hypothetical protein